MAGELSDDWLSQWCPETPEPFFGLDRSPPVCRPSRFDYGWDANGAPVSDFPDEGVAPMTNDDTGRMMASVRRQLAETATPAGRWAFVDALLSATTVETCPCCGQEVVKPAPLISRETALKMLEPPDAISEP
jgi:hypothetical protein